MDRFELEITEALRQLEIPAHLRGYRFIKSAMAYLRENPNALYGITKEVYPAVAEEHDSTPSRVERGIRHAIETSRANDAVWYRVLGATGHMTNAEFLATLGEAIRVKMAVEGKE